MNPPVGYAAVTTPLVTTVCWSSGLVGPVPWISSMVLATGSPGGGVLPEAEFSGFGAAAVKSAALSSVSVPAAARVAAVLFVSPGAGAVPSYVVAVAP